MKCAVEGIVSKSLPFAWPQAAPLIQRVLEKTDAGDSLRNVAEHLAAGRYQLWKVGNWDAAAVTSVKRYPEYGVVLCLYVGGEGADGWFGDLMSELEAWAAHMDCRYVEAMGRPGWSRMARRRGYEDFRIYRKRVDGQE